LRQTHGDWFASVLNKPIGVKHQQRPGVEAHRGVRPLVPSRPMIGNDVAQSSHLVPSEAFMTSPGGSPADEYASLHLKVSITALL
jgi:hypothetical protein